MICPHGGSLVCRVVSPAESAALAQEAACLPQVVLNERELADLELIACGAMSPLEGFMTEPDYGSVLTQKRLANGLVWTLPVVLSAKCENPEYRAGDRVSLVTREGVPLAVMEVEDCYRVDHAREAEQALGTTDQGHPGVQYLQSISSVYLGGRIHLLQTSDDRSFASYRLEPSQTRALFQEKGWRTIVAFQTRNPIHRAHEYLQKCALELVDGLLIHPLVGETKADDIPAEVRMRCYEALLEGYFPQGRAVLSVFPGAMRYAGPREAVFHALVRKNYGCTHFIVGRDHAGTGNYYGPYDAQTIFDEFTPEEIGITPLFFDNAFYCRACGGMGTTKTCPHSDGDRVLLSGSELRAKLARGEHPATEYTRPEVAKVLIESMGRKVR